MSHRDIFHADQEDWEKNAPFYAGEIESPFMEVFNKRKEEVYCIEPHLRVLDLGAGAGGFSQRLKKSGKRVVAADFAQEMAKVAQARFPGLTYICASANALPFKDGSFDVVIADGLLHHLKVQGLLREGLVEIRRVLNDGGKLCVFDRNGSFCSNFFLFFFMKIHAIVRGIKGYFPGSSSRHEPTFGNKDVVFVEDQGFTIIRRRNVSSLVFYLAIVFTNGVNYFFGPRLSVALGKVLFHPAAFFEKNISNRQLTIEQCIVFKKKVLGES